MKTLSSLVQATALAGALALSPAAFAQSTDPSHPSPWTGYGINGRGPGRDVTYYYNVSCPPGTLQAHLRTRAARSTTGTTVDFFDSGHSPLGHTSATADAGSSQDGATDVRVSHRESLLMAIHLDNNAGDYSVWLDLPRATPLTLPRIEERVNPEALHAAATGRWPAPAVPSTPWEMSGSGDGTSHDFYYPVVVNPGDITLQVTCQARTFSTAVTLDLEDASGASLRRLGAIATAAPVTESSRWTVTGRQNLRLHVNVDANCGPYSWSLTGPVEHY